MRNTSRSPRCPIPSTSHNRPLTLLLRPSDRPTPPTRRLRVLTTDTQTPVMSQTAMGADLLQSLEIVAQLAVDAVGEDLAVLAVHDVALSVEEPARDLVLGRVLDDGDDALEFFRGEFTGAVGG